MAHGSVTNLEQVSFAVPKRATMLDIPAALPTHIGDTGDRVKIVPGDLGADGVIIAGDRRGQTGVVYYDRVWFVLTTYSGGVDLINWLNTQVGQWFYFFGRTDLSRDGVPAGTDVGSVVRLSYTLPTRFLYPYPREGQPPYLIETRVEPNIDSKLDFNFQDSGLPSSTLQCFKITQPGRVDSDGVRQPYLPDGGNLPAYANATITSVGTLQPTNLSYSRGDPGEIIQVGNANVVVGASKTTETMEGVYTPDTYFNIDDFPLNPIMKLETVNDKNFAVTEFQSADAVGSKWNVQLQRKITTPVDIPPQDASFTPEPSNVQIFDTENVVNFISSSPFYYSEFNRKKDNTIPELSFSWFSHQVGKFLIGPYIRWRPNNDYDPLEVYFSNASVRANIGPQTPTLFVSQIDSDEVINIGVQLRVNDIHHHTAGDLMNAYEGSSGEWSINQDHEDATPGISTNNIPWDNGAQLIVSTDKFWRTETRNNPDKKAEPQIQEYWIYSSNVNNFSTQRWGDSYNVSSEALQGMINTEGEDKFSITGNAAYFEKIVRMVDSPNYLSNSTPGVTDAELAANRAYETTLYLSRLGTVANAAENGR